MSYDAVSAPVWPLLPNWKSGVRETLGWRTEVLGPSYTGVRQKRERRSSPRRTFEFAVHPHAAGQRLLQNLKFGQGAREWMLPIWHDRQSVDAMSIGNYIIACDVEGYDFSNYALLRSPVLGAFDTFEVVEIASVEDYGLFLNEPLTMNWPAGTRFYPLRRARMMEPSISNFITNDVATETVAFEISEPCTSPEHTFADTYQGYPVWDARPDWRDNRTVSFNRELVIVDNDTAMPTVFDFPDAAFPMSSMRWMAKNRAQHAMQRSVLYSLRGRFKSLWVPSWLQDLKMVATLGSASTALVVSWCGYTLFAKHQPNRRDVRIELRDGSIYYRRITAEMSSGLTETLTLDSALGVEVLAGAVKMISFMSLSQLSTDEFSLDHVTDANGVTVLSLGFEGIVQPPA